MATREPMVANIEHRLAVLISAEGSLSPREIVASAEGLTKLFFLVDRVTSSGDLRDIAEQLAPTTLVDFSDQNSCMAALRSLNVAGVLTFTDGLCPLASALNSSCTGQGGAGGLWGKKDAQRRALFDVQLSRIRSARIDSVDAVPAFLREVGYPIVVKPVDGVGSGNTWILNAPADTATFMRSARGGYQEQPKLRMFAEQLISGSPTPNRQLADYVSAEIFRLPAQGGDLGPTTALAFVTDRLVPAWPFRETGSMLPTIRDTYIQAQVINLGEKALDVLGAGAGTYHVEIKPMSPEPEIIEVNGRIGGSIARLAHYGAGADLGRVTLSIALGLGSGLDLNWRRCVLSLFFQPPADAKQIVIAPSRREVMALNGVIAVDKITQPGPSPDWRDGTKGAVAKVWLAANDHDALFSCLAEAALFLSEKFTFTDGLGRKVLDREWIELMTTGER